MGLCGEDAEVSEKLIGAILLVSSSTIGASMLALPTVTHRAGFPPSALTLIAGWVYMCASGLLLLEVSAEVGSRPEMTGREVNFISMVHTTLGVFGEALAWLGIGLSGPCFFCAYIVQDGAIISEVLQSVTGVETPLFVGCIAFTAVFGSLIVAGTETVDRWNRVLSVGLALSFLTLLIVSAPHMSPANLLYASWFKAVPVVAITLNAFCFHGVIPSVLSYLDHNVRAAAKAVVVGSAIPLVVYLAWNALVLGITPFRGWRAFEGSSGSVLVAMQTAAGVPAVLPIASTFAFLAVATSFLGFGIGFVDFLSDGLKVRNDGAPRLYLCALCMFPPLALSLFNPDIFFRVIEFSGVLGTILFGLFPPMMVLALRREGQGHTLSANTVVDEVINSGGDTNNLHQQPLDCGEISHEEGLNGSSQKQSTLLQIGQAVDDCIIIEEEDCFSGNGLVVTDESEPTSKPKEFELLLGGMPALWLMLLVSFMIVIMEIVDQFIVPLR